MEDALSSAVPCLDALESLEVRNTPVHIHRTGAIDSTTALPSIVLLMLFDVRSLLSESHVSEQDALSRLTKLQKRFFTFEELGLQAPACAATISKEKHDLSAAVVKQIKSSSKANGFWFVTVDAALKLVFRYCSPQDAIRVSLELSPLLIATYGARTDPLDVLENVNVNNLPREFQLAMEQRMKDKRTKQRFSGVDAVDWLVKSGGAATRTRAVDIAGRLMGNGLFHAVRSSASSSNAGFVDKSTELYSFERADDLSTSSLSGVTHSGSSSNIRTSSKGSNSSAGGSSSSTSNLALNLKMASKMNMNASGGSSGSLTGRAGNSSSGQIQSGSGTGGGRDSGSPHSASHTPSSIVSHSSSSGLAPSQYLPQPYSIYILGLDKSGKSTIWSALTGKKSGHASVRNPFDRPWNHVQMDRLTFSMDNEDFPGQLATFCIWDFDHHPPSKSQNSTSGASSNSLSLAGALSDSQSLSTAVHRSFVSFHARCSSLVVFDVNNPDLVELDYWVASIAQHQPAAPIILVGTHSDTVSAKTKSKIKLLISKRYAKVKNVRGYLTMSAKSGSDIDKLRELLLTHSLHALAAQIRRERPKITLDVSYEAAIEAVAQNLNSLRVNGSTFVPLADIRQDLLARHVPEDQVDAAMVYLAANGCFLKMPDSLDQFTLLYGKPESDIKHWAILDFDYPYKLLYALNAAPPMMKLRGLISLASVMEAWKAVEVPHEFMLDFLAYQYHMLRTTYCMVSLLINTVIQEKAIEDAAKTEAGIMEQQQSNRFGDDNDHQSDVPSSPHHTSNKTSTRRTSTSNRSAIVRPPPLGQNQGNGTIEAKILARVPNPDMHCFSLPSAIPRSFDQKQLGWARVQKNELVRVYALERIPAQLLERACIQLVLAVLTQLRTPFLSKESGGKPESNGEKAATGKLKKQKSSGVKKVKRKASSIREDDKKEDKKSPSATAAAATTDDGPADAIGRARSSSRSRSRELQHTIEREDSSSSSPLKRRSKHKHAANGTSPSEKPSPLALGGLSSADLSNSPTTDSPLSAATSTHSPSNSPSPSPRGASRRAGSSSSLSSAGSGSPRHRESKDGNETTSINKSGHKDEKEHKKKAKKAASVPKSEKSKEVLQALQDIVCEHIEWTQQGIAFTVGGEMGFSARLYSIEGPQHETALIIRVTSETFAGSSRGLRLILDNINAFVLWEYKTSVSDVFIPCACADCLKARSSPKYVPLPVFKNAATFTFDECERAIGAGYATLPCSVYGNEVPLDRLVPDLVMSDLEMFHADYSDIVKEVELARSSNGIVYRGTYLGETVAIKELSVRLAGDGLVDAVASEYFADFRHEVWVSSLLKHENIVGLKAFAIQTVLIGDNGEEIPVDALLDSSDSSSSSSRVSFSRESSSIDRGNGDAKSKSSKKENLVTQRSESDFSKVHAQFGQNELAHSNYESATSTKDSISSVSSSMHSQSTPKLSSQSSSGSGYFSNMSTASSNSTGILTQNSSAYERIAKLAIVMEYIPNGDLYRWLNDKNAVIDWDMRLRIAEEVAQGMYFLHTLNPPILHHDLKSANIFIVDKSKHAPVVCRVGDFGEARTNFSYNSRERVDNPIWLAPEVMQKQRYESGADVYAFGIILWELFARDHPFDEYPEARSDFLSVLEDAIVGGLRPSIPDKKVEAELPISATSNVCVPLYAYLMRECWQTDRFRRPTFARIISTLQDIRALMKMNEKRILSSDKPNAARSHQRDLTATEQEWVSIVEDAERANADGVSIQTLQSQNAEVKQKTESLRTSVALQPISPETEEKKDVPTTPTSAKVESPKKTEPVQVKVEAASAEVVEAPQPAKDLNDMVSELPSKLSASEEEQKDASLRKTQLIAPTPQPAAVAPILVQAVEDKNVKPIIVVDDKSTGETVKHSLPKPDAAAAAVAAAQQTDIKAKVYSTMANLVALNRRDSDTPPFMMRRGSMSGSPSQSSEALLLQYSNPSLLSKSTTVGLSALTPSPMAGLSLRKKLATSAMIPLNFLPTMHHDHDAELSEDDEGDE